MTEYFKKLETLKGEREMLEMQIENGLTDEGERIAQKRLSGIEKMRGAICRLLNEIQVIEAVM